MLPASMAANVVLTTDFFLDDFDLNGKMNIKKFKEHWCTMKCNRDGDFLRCKNSYRAAKSSYTKNKWEKCRLPPELSKTIRHSIRSNDWTHSLYLKPILKEMSREIWIKEDSVKFA